MTRRILLLESYPRADAKVLTRFAVCVVFCVLGLTLRAQAPPFATPWKSDSFATIGYEINGTEGRGNPLRRQLDRPFHGDELFVRYRIRYDKDSLDTPQSDEGEFLVLWLDEAEGNSGSTHSGGVPNIGIHVSGNQNRFMVRYSSRQERFAAEVLGDRDFLVVARLWKSQSGADQPFDQLDLWVDPKSDVEDSPDASAESAMAIGTVAWIGFSTGVKTEIEDRIFVWDIALASTWREVLELPEILPVETPAEKVAKRTIDFDKHILPLLSEKCFSCHSGNEAEIRLDVHDEVLNLCSLGRSDESQLYQQVSTGQMPPDDEPQLSASEIATFKTWIDEGLAWNANRLPPPRPTTDHWSFQPIVRPDVPKVNRVGWVRNPVDAFIARKQESLGVTPADPADGTTLARRMSLDMLGLPPTKSSYTVDELLGDPAYGERWARHWLDVARWAESNGHQHNRIRPYAWRYRDWVVDAFNRDLPFDRFLLEQIAGDELPARETTDDGPLIATGFLAAARYSGNELDKRIQRNDILVDVVNTTASAFLGLTLECAQCHTHKFDPISLRDYYRLQAFFADGQPANVSFAAESEAAGPLVRERWEIFDRSYQRLVKVRRRRGDPTAELVIPKSVVAKMPSADKKRFEQLEKQIAAFDQTWAFCSPKQRDEGRTVTPHEMRWPLPRDRSDANQPAVSMLLRGDINSPGPEVEPGWPLVFGHTPEAAKSSRTSLAAWMTGQNNPLTARVWVNRIWYWHFGKGLVESVGDFGSQGTPPTHLELLDYLASELIVHGWSTNHIHRLILGSSTYRQSSSYLESNAALDPTNATYWRWTPRRLEAEAIRDCMLAASGQLDLAPGGPSDSDAPNSKRRSIYLRQRRQLLPHQQILFDGKIGHASCSRRLVSTNALQPLWLLNSEFSHQAATALAKHSDSVGGAFVRCLGRSPNRDELARLQSHAKQHGLASACLVLFSSSEFLYIP